MHPRPALVNGTPGLLLGPHGDVSDGHITAAISLTVAGGRITAVDIVVNPDKLVRAGARWLENR